MVDILFYDRRNEMICNVDASDNLPDEVTSMDVEGPFDSSKSSFKCLTAMLKSGSSKQLEHIDCWNLNEDDSPEFLAFLAQLCNASYSLHFSSCQLSTNAVSCLMPSLLMSGGIRSLSFRLEQWSMPTLQAKILLEGVACSPYLESFDLDVVNFEESGDVGRYLTKTLIENQSLKHIRLRTQAFSGNEFRNLLRASIFGPNVKTVSIVDAGREVRLDVLSDLVCRKDATLEGLHLERVEILTENSWEGSVIQNLSVTSLKVRGMVETGDKLRKTIGMFKSLVQLDLSNSGVTDTGFLDHLLFGETSQLQCLNLRENRIGGEEMKNFIRKLRNIKGLKYLALLGNDCVKSESISTALIDALRRNLDIEFVDFDKRDLPLDLNRGGRRVFESPERFPRNLLPQVLERASKISYYYPEKSEYHAEKWFRPSVEEARVDVVFWMIHRIVPEL